VHGGGRFGKKQKKENSKKKKNMEKEREVMI